MIFRNATVADIPALMELYQKACLTASEDPLFIDRRRLRAALELEQDTWMVAERGGQLIASVSFNTERDHQLCKIHRMYALQEDGDPEGILRQTLSAAIASLSDHNLADVIYTTTRSLSPSQQQLTLELGFKVLGIFPNALGADRTRLNGLTALYLGDTLTQRRFTDFQLHPKLQRFFDIVSRECALPPLGPVSDAGQLQRLSALSSVDSALPGLEVINAPRFVKHRFRQLRDRKYLSMTFYPFTEPDALITDVNQKIEVFVRIVKPMRFGVIIGERIETPVDPVELYREIARLLRAEGVGYIEVINDAADAEGLECILQAGFLPCAYFPCLKNHGEHRRDYVVLSRSFEMPTFTDADVGSTYLDYFREYLRLQRSSLFPPEWEDLV